MTEHQQSNEGDSDPPDDRQVMDHVFHKILRYPGQPTPAIKLFCEQQGYYDINTLIYMPENVIFNGRYDPGDGQSISVPTAHQYACVHLRMYHQLRREQAKPILDWTKVTRADFDYFIQNDLHDYASQQRPTTPGEGNTTTSARSLDKEFDRGIKREKESFPKLVDGKNWDSYLRSFTIVAKAQGVDKVLDPTYRPHGREAQALFERMGLACSLRS